MVSESQPALLSDSEGDAGTVAFFMPSALLKCAQVATHRLLHYWPIKAGVNEKTKNNEQLIVNKMWEVVECGGVGQ